MSRIQTTAGAALMLAAMLLTVGCATQHDYLKPTRLDGPIAGYIALADARVAQLAAEWNKTSQFQIGLADYEKSAEIGCWQEYRRWGNGPYRPILIVSYHLTKPTGVLDGPNQVTYYIYLDNCEVHAVSV